MDAFAWDGLSRVASHTSPDPDGPAGPLASPVESWGYNLASEVITTRDPLLRDTNYARDNLGRVTGITDELNQNTGFLHDAVGNVLQQTDAQGFKLQNAYDAVDQLIETRDARHGKTRFDFDAVGNMVLLIDPQQNATQWEFDRLDRTTSDVNQLGGRRKFEYDQEGDLVRQTDRNGRATEWVRDSLGRATQELWKDGLTTVRTIVSAFDLRDRLTSASDPVSSYGYGYDFLDRVTSVTNAGTPGVPTVLLNNVFDTNSRRTELKATVNGVADFKNVYTSDNLDRMTRVDQTSQPGGNAVAEKRVDFEYNPLDQFTKISRYKDTDGGTANEVATSNFVRDTLARLTNLDHKKDAATIAALSWSYDTLNRVTNFTSPDGAANYSYDTTSQVVGVDNSGTNPDEAFVNDLNGNRANQGWVSGDNNRLLADGTYNYVYDQEGNRTRRTLIATGAYEDYTWDHRNRLTSVISKTSAGVVTKEVLYKYDVFDSRISKSVDSDGPGPAAALIARFVYDAENIVLEFDPGAPGPATHRYLHGPEMDQILADEVIGAGVRWALADNLGTVRDVIDNSGLVLNHLVYGAFGNVTSETAPTVDFLFAFTGRERDGGL